MLIWKEQKTHASTVLFLLCKEKSDVWQLMALRQHLREVLVNVFATWDLQHDLKEKCRNTVSVKPKVSVIS